MNDYICPDCGHDESEHMVFDGVYKCVGSGKCKCDKTSKEVLFEIIASRNQALAEAREALKPFAEERISKLDKDTDHDEFWMEVGHFRRAAEWLKKYP